MNPETFGNAQQAKESLQRLTEALAKAWNGGEIRLSQDRIEQLEESVKVIEATLPEVKQLLGWFYGISLKK